MSLIHFYITLPVNMHLSKFPHSTSFTQLHIVILPQQRCNWTSKVQLIRVKPGLFHLSWMFLIQHVCNNPVFHGWYFYGEQVHKEKQKPIPKIETVYTSYSCKMKQHSGKSICFLEMHMYIYFFFFLFYIFSLYFYTLSK